MSKQTAAVFEPLIIFDNSIFRGGLSYEKSHLYDRTVKRYQPG